MQAEELIKLINKVQHFKYEFQRVEVKAAMHGCPTRLFDTLSSFSNQDDGGIILFGLDERNGFETVGVYDVQDLMHNVAEQCKQMEPEVRPLFTTVEVNGLFVVSAEIPSVDVDQRPVYYKGAGRQKGSFVRVGESDEPMNDYEIYNYDAFRKRVRDDIRVVPNAKMNQLREEVIQKYIEIIKNGSQNLASSSTDAEIMELMGLTCEGNPTMSTVLVFGKYPQAYFPMLGITAVVVPGLQMGDTNAEGARFIANQRINGTIGEMLAEAVRFVERNIRVKTIIDENGKRNDKPEFPIKAVREVILNALLHRDYSIHAEGSPVTICMFYDRMEVTNKGALYGRLSINQLGKVRCEVRNPTLVDILEVLHVCENRYSGIPTIIKEMRDAGLPEPEFITQGGEFKVILKNNIASEIHREKAETRSREKTRQRKRTKEELLDFCNVPRSREELTEFLGFSRFYTMEKIIKPLLANGTLEFTMPEKPKSKNQKYVRKLTT